MSDDPTAPYDSEIEHRLEAPPSDPLLRVAGSFEQSMAVHAALSGCADEPQLNLRHPARRVRTRTTCIRVGGLVDALDCLPGVVTFSSCGGHDEPVDLQARYPAWYVKLGIEPTPEAHDSLTRIMASVKKHEPEASLFPWWHGGEYTGVLYWGEYTGYEDVICFRLGGECEPEALVETLEALNT